MSDARPTFDLMSGTWSDGRREPILDYFDWARGIGRRPKHRKDRPPEQVFPFGESCLTGRPLPTTIPYVPLKGSRIGLDPPRTPYSRVFAEGGPRGPGAR